MSMYQTSGPNIRRAQGGVRCMAARRQPFVTHLTFCHSVRSGLGLDTVATVASGAPPRAAAAGTSALPSICSDLVEFISARLDGPFSVLAVPNFMTRWRRPY